MKDKLQFFRIAKRLNEEFKSELLEIGAHFRANENSFSLVSLNPLTPELGISNLKTTDGGTKALHSDEFANLKSPERDTPEKSLQAWIINYALNNKHKLPFDENIKFITSELAISIGDRRRVVTDILGYCEKEKQICVIELKSERALKELKKQVNDFEEIILKNQSFFSELLSLYDIENPNGFHKIKKIIVWPHAKTSPLEEFKKADVDILEVTYKKSYEFIVH